MTAFGAGLNRTLLSLALCAALVGVWIIGVAKMNRPFIGDQVDDGQYLVGAISLGAGSGYRLISRPGNPIATKYPPAVSAVTALIAAALHTTPFLTSFRIAARVLMATCAVFLGASAYFFSRIVGLSFNVSLLIAASVLFHPATVSYTLYLNSDLPFALIAALLMCGWTSADRVKNNLACRDSVKRATLAAIGTLIRSSGILLLAISLLLEFGYRRSRWRRALIFTSVSCGIVVICRLLVQSQHGVRDTGSYWTEQVSAYTAAPHFWTIATTNATAMLPLLGGMIEPILNWTVIANKVHQSHPLMFAMVVLCITAWVFLGLFFLYGRIGNLVILYAVLLTSLHIVWHYLIEMRFLLPLFPLFLIAAIYGFAKSCSAVPGLSSSHERVRLVAASLVLASSIAIFANTIVHSQQNPSAESSDALSLQAAFKSIDAQTPLDAVIICEVPELIYLNTGRQAAPLVDDSRKFANMLPSWRSSEHWLILARGRPLYLLASCNGATEFSRGSPFKLQLIYQSLATDLYLYRLQRV